MSVLYVIEEGSVLKKDGYRIVIEKNDNIIREIPIEKVESIVLFTGTHLTSPCTMFLLERDIPVTWLSKRGKFFGRLISTKKINIFRQRKQFILGENKEFCLGLSKNIILGKVKNSKVILRRFKRDNYTEEIDYAIQEFDNYICKIENSNTINELIGFEGYISKIYFRAIGSIFEDEFKFLKRTRQPPLDPINSLLSFGYTLLMYDVYTSIENRGLSAYAGFLHKDKNNHPTLSSDMMEEWRSVLIDSMVIKLIRNKIINIDYFYKSQNGGIYLNSKASRVFIGEYSKKIMTTNKYLELTEKANYRDSINYQVRLLSKAIDSEEYEIYKPFQIR